MKNLGGNKKKHHDIHKYYGGITVFWACFQGQNKYLYYM